MGQVDWWTLTLLFCNDKVCPPALKFAGRSGLLSESVFLATCFGKSLFVCLRVICTPTKTHSQKPTHLNVSGELGKEVTEGAPS